MRILGAFLLATVAGCAQLPGSSPADRPAMDFPEPPAAEPNGAIYQPQRGFRPLFEDRRPHMIGDVITIVLDEEVSASKNARSNAGRSSSASFSADTLPDSLAALADYGFDLGGDSDFEGGGGSEASNTFTGTLTVMVTDVMPNGNLRVQGEKEIAINQGREFIRFAGVLDPLAVSGDSTVPSSRVADARIEYAGDGYISQAQRMGWLQRLFLNVSPF